MRRAPTDLDGDACPAWPGLPQCHNGLSFLEHVHLAGARLLRGHPLDGGLGVLEYRNPGKEKLKLNFGNLPSRNKPEKINAEVQTLGIDAQLPNFNYNFGNSNISDGNSDDSSDTSSSSSNNSQETIINPSTPKDLVRGHLSSRSRSGALARTV